MALDEALLAAAAIKDVATLRLYQWSEPTLSLGYFQRYADREQHLASRDCAIVRRQTGGGAILHDRELTYSLTLPASHPLARRNERLYTAVHQAVINCLMAAIVGRQAQWALELRANPPAIRPADEPFLCFARRAQGDLLLAELTTVNAAAVRHAEWKILGSAQRRHRGAILQHGSLLLEASPAAPELSGFRDLTGASVGVPDLVSSLPSQIAAVVGLSMHKTMLSNEMRSRAEEIENAKYGAPAWTKRR